MPTFKVGDFTYKTLNEKEVLIGDDSGNDANAVDKDKSYSKDIFIPNFVSYNNIRYAVTQVGRYAFHSVESKHFIIGRNIQILKVYAIFNPSVESILFEEGSKCYKIDNCGLSPPITKENFVFYLPSSLKEIHYRSIANVRKPIIIYYCGSSLINTATFKYASMMTIYVSLKYPSNAQFMGVNPIVDDSITCKFSPSIDKENRRVSICNYFLKHICLANNSFITTLFCSTYSNNETKKK